MRWGWGAAAILALGVIYVSSGWVHAGIVAYHLVCLAGIVRHRTSIRPLLGGAVRTLGWTFATTLLIVGGLLAPLLFWDPSSIREEAARTLFPAEGRERFFAVFAAYTLLAHAWIEEVFWRGVFTRPDARPGAAALGNAGAFYLVHAVALGWALGWTGVVLALPTAGAGAAWGWVTRRTGSLWPAVVSHYAADVAILAGMWIYLVRA